MAAVNIFTTVAQANPALVLYQAVVNNANNGSLTNVSALLPSGAGTKKMDRPTQPGRTKAKFINDIVVDGKSETTVMSFVASNNFTNYKLAAELLGQAAGRDFSAYVNEFARQYGLGEAKSKSSKSKSATTNYVDFPESWRHLGNAVPTASLSPSPKAATGSPKAATPK